MHLSVSAGVSAGRGVVDPVGAFFSELIRAGIYKRSQGRVTRQVTFAAIVIVAAMGLWRMVHLSSMLNQNVAVRFGIAGVALAGVAWIAYRLVNVPMFADFLIAVEAEMTKVSWPTRHELIRASVVVLVAMVALTVVLYAFDIFWIYFLQRVGVLATG
jgi:preprotein translocase subunit SecE